MSGIRFNKWRSSAILVFAAASLATGFGQQPGTPGTPVRPLRERLLEQALKGDASAQFDLGKNYETGRIGLPKDMAQAIHWYREAADRGEPFAEASMGINYQFGKGVTKDVFQAYFWYELAISHLTGGDRQTVVEMRDAIAGELSPAQISEARRLAKEWKPASGK